MSLTRYLAFIEITLNSRIKRFSPHDFTKKKLCYAKIWKDDETLRFSVSDKRLECIYPTGNYTENKTICSLHWINTRNKFSLHILKSLLHYQRTYLLSGKEVHLRPLTIGRFLALYPLRHLDQSRLSRLVPHLSVVNPQNRAITLRSLFISKKIPRVSY